MFVLDGPDMLLHNAVHLFMNDDLRGGLRDVVDFVTCSNISGRRIPISTGACWRVPPSWDRPRPVRRGRRWRSVHRPTSHRISSRALAGFAGAPVAALMDRLTASVFRPEAPGGIGAMRSPAGPVRALALDPHAAADAGATPGAQGFHLAS